MKTIGRILVILVAALLVVGATVAVTQSGLLNNVGAFGGRGLGQGEGFGRGQRGGQHAARGGLAANATGSEPRGDFEHDGGFDILGVQPLLKNLGIIAAITVVVVGIGFMSKRLRSRKTDILAASAVSGGESSAGANGGLV